MAVRNTTALPGRRDPWRDLSRLELPAVLVSLDDMVIRAVTAGGQRLLGLPVTEIVGRSVAQHIHPSDHDWVLASFAALRGGRVDFYRGRTHGMLASGQTTPLITWVRALDLDDRRFALAAWTEADGLPSPTIEQLLAQALAFLVADPSGIVLHAALDEDVDGLTSADLVGARLAPMDAIAGLAISEGAASDPDAALSVALPISITTVAGEVVTVRAICTSFADSAERLIMLLRPEPIGAARARELEDHLWRIASEVEASGILHRAQAIRGLAVSHLPEVARLSPRQLEVLRRLADGQRVSTIAADMYLSPSTVRNHLSAIFDRFGVHSQAELLERLSSSEDAPR